MITVNGRMVTMTEDEALERVDEIGQAFANDLCDDDSEILYEGLITHVPVAGPNKREGVRFLEYTATFEDGSKYTFRWVLTLFSRKVDH
jgi:hypothetical protein